MKVTIKTAHGYLSPQPPTAKNPAVRWEYRDTAGAWETLELVGLELPDLPEPPDPPDPTPPEPEPGPTPPTTGDAIDLSLAVVASSDCPPVAHLPILASMSLISLKNVGTDGQGFALNFPGRDTWPGVIPPGWDGAINHTLWIAEFIGGTWYVLPVKEGLHDYLTLGPILNPGQVPENLTYFAQSPMQGYQPRPAEQVGFFATTGDTRRMNLQPASGAGRTNVVLVPFTAGEYTFPAASGTQTVVVVAATTKGQP
jgi:hypothetical protein